MRYWSDLQGTTLSEETNHQWVHALSLGNFKHPSYGTLDFTLDRIQRFADSVKQKVRGIDPDIDYDHKLDPAKGNVAAGWVKDADVRDNGLWLLVEWTNEAKQALDDKKYRYFSTEFVKEWVNDKGEKFQDVILGGGLTNRPFLKDLVPVNLSDLFTEENEMDRAELVRILGLSEDATDDDIKNKLTQLSEAKTDPQPIDLSKVDVKVGDNGKLIVTHPDAGDSTWEGELPKVQEDQTDHEKELAKLAETNPAVAKILTEQATMREEFKVFKATARLSEVSTQLSELGTDEKKALPPAVSNKFRDLMVQLPQKLSDEVADALKELLKVGTVDLSESTSRSKDGKQTDTSNVVKKYLAEVDKVASEQKLSIIDASAVVNDEQPHLYSDYLDAVEESNVLTEQEA